MDRTQLFVSAIVGFADMIKRGVTTGTPVHSATASMFDCRSG